MLLTLSTQAVSCSGQLQCQGFTFSLPQLRFCPFVDHSWGQLMALGVLGASAPSGFGRFPRGSCAVPASALPA